MFFCCDAQDLLLVGAYDLMGRHIYFLPLVFLMIFSYSLADKDARRRFFDKGVNLMLLNERI